MHKSISGLQYIRGNNWSFQNWKYVPFKAAVSDTAEPRATHTKSSLISINTCNTAKDFPKALHLVTSAETG